MTISTNNLFKEVAATNVAFQNNLLIIFLSDGRSLSVPMDTIEWLRWLANASPKQRENWHIEPGGFAIYWEELDNGIEITHLLGMQSLI